MTIKEIVEKRANLLKQFKEYANGDDWDKQTADKMYEDIKKLDDQKKSMEVADELLAMKIEREEERKDIKDDVPGFADNLDSFFRTGEGGVQVGTKKREFTLYDPSMGAELRANQFYRGTANKGGSLVPALLGDHIDAARAFIGGMVTPGLVNWAQVGTGNTITYPTYDDTATKAAVIAEKTDASSGTDLTYGTSDLTFYKITTKFIKVSSELLQDSVYDVTGHLLGMLAERMQRGLNYYFTSGTGTAMPYGMDAVSTKGEDCLARSVTRTDIINLVYSINRAYRSNASFQMNDSTVKAIRALDFGSADSRPLWSESMQKGEPPRLEGHPVIVNNEIEEFQPFADIIFFGDFKNYYVREALPMKIQRVDELYAATDEVGFNLIGRWAGNKVSGGTPWKHMRCAST